jgi:hypothetical protein
LLRVTKGGTMRNGMRRGGRTHLRILAGLLLASLLVALLPGAAAAGASGTTTLEASLRGANEVPGPGDPDGRGAARIVLGGDRVCFALQWRDISAPVMAHIHAGTRDVAGPVVVDFLGGMVEGGLPATLRSAAGCVDGVDRKLVKAIKRHPGRYYVNVHTADFMAGAIRGQLSKGAPDLRDLDANLRAKLTGEAEVPGPGDPDGSGFALVRAKGERVCFVVAWRRINPPVMAHIHAGTKDVAGPVVVDFLGGMVEGGLPATLRAVDGCVDGVDPKLVKAIKRHPRNYYVNVHTADFMAGAIRGQLRKAG